MKAQNLNTELQKAQEKLDKIEDILEWHSFENKDGSPMPLKDSCILQLESIGILFAKDHDAEETSSEENIEGEKTTNEKTHGQLTLEIEELHKVLRALWKMAEVERERDAMEMEEMCDIICGMMENVDLNIGLIAEGRDPVVHPDTERYDALSKVDSQAIQIRTLEKKLKKAEKRAVLVQTDDQPTEDTKDTNSPEGNTQTPK